jgi:hypothetical protein
MPNSEELDQPELLTGDNVQPSLVGCLVCGSGGCEPFGVVDGVDYFECGECGSIFVDREFLQEKRPDVSHYDDSYWENEIAASRERSFGPSINRVCEVFLYSRIPIKRFVDIGAGPGYLLEALSNLAPNYRDLFYGCELFPPPARFRTQHENYTIGSLSQLPGKFSAGVCIEVIEHLTPEQLNDLIAQMAISAEDGAVFYFNSAQPSFVKNIDPGYLDPLHRGHIVSYSLKALETMFANHGFTLIELPGRDWCFLVEYNSESQNIDAEGLLNRIWTAPPENVSILKDNGFGPLLYTTGVESARCYLEHAKVLERTAWARSLNEEKQSLIEENRSLIEKNQSLIEENRSSVVGDQSLIVEN